MKKHLLFVAGIAIFLLSHLVSTAQTTVTLKLNANEEDATIDDYVPGQNSPGEIEYFSGAWTINGTPVIWRNFFKFNLSYIPSDAIILSAHLNLYFATQNSFGGDQSSLTSSNESVVQRVISPWTENSVTWNTQPSATTQDQAILTQSTSPTQDYPNIDVTAMVQYMFYNPSSDFGFMLKLTNETYYARMIFASGDNPDSTKHPELVITYTTPCTVLTIDANGEDAVLDTYNPGSTNPDSPDYCSGFWTIFGTPVNYHNLFKFDFSSIPSNAIIQSALMNLFYAPNNLFYANDTSLTNSNESVLQRITTSWSENTVTWNTQPSTTTLNEVILPQSTSGNQDYTNIDVTALVQDMFANPSTSYGFMLHLTNEAYYARLLFASGDNSIIYMHPQLELCYTVTSVPEINCESNFMISPNPSKGKAIVSWQNCGNKFEQFEVINSIGQTVAEKNISSQTQTELDLSAQPSGLYFVKLSGNGNLLIRKIVLY